jgi:hypothetical protein
LKQNYRIVTRKNLYLFLIFVYYGGLSYPVQDTIPGNNLSSESIKDEIVASVGPINITANEFYYGYEFGPAFVKREKGSKERYLKYMINEKLLALDGYSRGIDKKEESKSILQDFKNDLATEEMFKEDVLNKIEINEKEIDTVITQKELELDIRWLFAKTEDELNSYLKSLASGVSFDSLYGLQFKDTSIYLDDRSMQLSRFQLGERNPELAGLIDSLPVGEVSKPVKTNDGWYLFKINNVTQNMVTTEAEMINLKQESIDAIKKKKMDKLSDEYVHNLLIRENPIIKRECFSILIPYIGFYSLKKELYDKWQLSDKMDEALQELSITKENAGQTKLVVMNKDTVTLEEFLKWYRDRSEYIKFNKSDLHSYSLSLENLIWRMVRDKLLSELAFKRNFYQKESVIEQSKWWEDKIVYSSVKNEIVQSVLLEEREVKLNNDKLKEDDINQKILRKLLIKLNKLKAKYKVNINKDVLDKIRVSDENNPKAIDVFTIKKGGLIPRPAYPSIDYDWINWE